MTDDASLQIDGELISPKGTFLNMMDHSFLNPNSSSGIERATKYAQEVVNYRMRGTCFRPDHVRIARDVFSSEPFGTYRNSSVLIFPRQKHVNIEGMIEDRKEQYTHTSLSDSRNALADIVIEKGANELDMIINLEAAQEKRYGDVRLDVESLRKHVGPDITLKVIECAPYFSDQDLANITSAVIDGGADYVKTTTGFGKRAASLRDVHIFGMVLSQEKSDAGIKAAGGIKNYPQAAAFYGASQWYGKRPFIIGESSYDLESNPLDFAESGDKY